MLRSRQDFLQLRIQIWAADRLRSAMWSLRRGQRLERRRLTVCCDIPIAKFAHVLVAYWATPSPNDQFSFWTSTILIKTSCGRMPGSFANLSTMLA